MNSAIINNDKSNVKEEDIVKRSGDDTDYFSASAAINEATTQTDQQQLVPIKTLNAMQAAATASPFNNKVMVNKIKNNRNSTATSKRKDSDINGVSNQCPAINNNGNAPRRSRQQQLASMKTFNAIQAAAAASPFHRYKINQTGIYSINSSKKTTRKQQNKKQPIQKHPQIRNTNRTALPLPVCLDGLDKREDNCINPIQKTIPDSITNNLKVANDEMAKIKNNVSTERPRSLVNKIQIQQDDNGKYSKYFPVILYGLLMQNNRRYKATIDWNPDGRSCVVRDAALFQQTVLNGNIFTHRNIESFSKQLRRYHFIVKRGQEFDFRTFKPKCTLFIKHPKFVRGEKDLCYEICQEKIQKQQKKAGESTASTSKCQNKCSKKEEPETTPQKKEDGGKYDEFEKQVSTKFSSMRNFIITSAQQSNADQQKNSSPSPTPTVLLPQQDGKTIINIKCIDEENGSKARSQQQHGEKRRRHSLPVSAAKPSSQVEQGAKSLSLETLAAAADAHRRFETRKKCDHNDDQSINKRKKIAFESGDLSSTRTRSE